MTGFSKVLGLVGVLTLGASALLAGCESDDGAKSVPGDGGADGQGGAQPAAGGDAAGGDVTGPSGAGAPAGPGALGPEAADLCDPPSGEGTVHGPFVSDDETWTAAGSPHLVPDGVSVDAVLTLEPCAVVQVGAGRDVRVNGKLVARGDYQEPMDVLKPATAHFVRIERLDPKQPWGALISSSAGGQIDLTATLVDGGGAVADGTKPLQTAMVVVEGERQQPLVERLTLDAAVLRNSASQGILLTNNVAFAAGSTAIVVGSGGYPILVGARAVGTVPDVYFEDNAADEVLVGTSERLGDAGPTDVVLRYLGVPYRIGTDLDTTQLEVGTGNGSAASLTIEPGVELRFPAQGGLSVEGPDGTLIAAGTDEKPIVFTSDAQTPAAGDWLGLNFDKQVADGTSLDQVVVAYAGASDTSARSFSCGTPLAAPMLEQQTMGAIYLSLDVAPTQSFVKNSLIQDSASNGVDRGYTGDAVDFSDSNTFERLAFCIQTEPKPSVGACSADPACPQLP